MKPNGAARPDIDWEAIEREYRAGQLSDREIGRQHGVSHTAIQKRAKRDKWSKNLEGKVRQRLAEKLAVASPVADNQSQEAKVAIEDAAQRGYEVVMLHRSSIARGRGLIAAMFDELAEVSHVADELEREAIEETKEDSAPHRRNLLMKAVSLHGRAGVARDLAAAMKSLIPLERQAFSLDQIPQTPSDPAQDARAEQVRLLLLAALSNMAQPALVIDQPKRLNGNGAGNGAAEHAPEPEDWPK